MERNLFLKKAGAVILALLVWQIAAMKIEQSILLVSPVDVIKRLFTIWKTDYFFESIWCTFYHIMGGFFLGLILGIIFAFISNRFEIVEILLWPWMITIKSVPVASFVVICLIWLKAENLSVFISFLIVLPVVYQNILNGLRAIDRNMKEMASLFKVSWHKRLKHIILPEIKPFLLSASSVTIGMAWKAGVAAEIIGIPQGSVGKMLYYSKIYLDTDDLLAWTVIIVIVSVLSEKVIVGVMKRLLQ